MLELKEVLYSERIREYEEKAEEARRKKGQQPPPKGRGLQKPLLTRPSASDTTLSVNIQAPVDVRSSPLLCGKWLNSSEG